MRVDFLTVNVCGSFADPIPAPDFIIPGYLAGTVGCLAAAGSTGKSYWALEAAMGVCSAAANRALLDLDIRQHGRALILNAEDPLDVIRRRLNAIGQLVDPAFWPEIGGNLDIKAMVGTQPDIMSDQCLEDIVRMAEGARLVVIDTLTRWHRLDENKNGDMSRVLSRFEVICRETGAAVLFLHHIAKGMALDERQHVQQATRGASAITDNARWQGWMRGMSPCEAKTLGITDGQRKSYVRFGGSKENYGQATAEAWLERKADGVLIPAALAPKAVKPRAGKSRTVKTRVEKPLAQKPRGEYTYV